MDKYKTLVDLFQQNKDIRKWQQDQQKRSRSLLLGLSSSTKAITMATVVEDGHKVLVLTSSQNEAERLASDLLGLLGEEKVYLFLPGTDLFSFGSSGLSPSSRKRRNRYCQCKW